ncbi:MAG: MMPL family transporter [Sneathiella sp.]|nr:MMPL family transporter [Sneathiella sp.]
MGSFFMLIETRLMAACLFVMALVVTLFLSLVDLNPKVSPDFFFGSNDPDLAQSARIHELFPSDEFLVISVAGTDIFSGGYYDRLATFSRNIEKIPGITRLVSAAAGPDSVRAASESPFWRPLLVSEDNRATLIIAFVGTQDTSNLVAEVEAAARLFDEGDAFRIRSSGMPYIVEQIRRNLVHDMQLFSTVSLVIFSVILLTVFRSPVIALGASASGITAIFLTLLILQGIGQPVGILTANLAIIVFVLVESQVIYLTSNWRQLTQPDKVSAVKQAVLQTFKASFWCMVTTLLGFATLLMVAAEPLRQLGMGGIVGAIVALLCSFALYPVFLLFATRRTPREAMSRVAAKPSKRLVWMLYCVGICLLLIAAVSVQGLFRLNTDPSLLSYFAVGSELREDLTFIDKNGGSSPVKLVVRLENGGRLDNEAGYEAMWRLHKNLLAEKNIGTVISLPALMAEANNHPLAFLLPWREIISLLSLGINQHVAENFLSEDRSEVLYVLRMKEEGRQQDRNQITAKLQQIVKNAGFKPVLTGGVYVLQGRLSELVATSLLMGIAGLLLLFAGIAWIVSRSIAITAAMVLTSALIPLTILGGAGWFAVPVDIISAPAANVCFGIAVDALIHLALSFNRYRLNGKHDAAWGSALREQSRGIIASSGIIATGFLIFSSSGFPPTARFGGEVVVGAVFAGAAALTLFPMFGRALAGLGDKR